MANNKITVKATEDFFDGANQIPRVKGSEFVLRADYAKSLGKAVQVVETKKEKTPKEERIAKARAKTKDVAASAKPSTKETRIVDKVKKK